MFYHFTWLFCDWQIAKELGPDMVPLSKETEYKGNRSMWAEMIF